MGPGTSHGGRYIQPKPKVRAGADPNQGLVDRTAQSKAAGATPPASRGPAKPPTPPRPLKRKAGADTKPALGRKRGQPKAAPPVSGATSSAEARPEGSKAKKPRSAKPVSTKSLVQVPPLESTYPDYEPLARGPRDYGTWLEQPSDTYVTGFWCFSVDADGEETSRTGWRTTASWCAALTSSARPILTFWTRPSGARSRKTSTTATSQHVGPQPRAAPSALFEKYAPGPAHYARSTRLKEWVACPQKRRCS